MSTAKFSSVQRDEGRLSCASLIPDCFQFYETDCIYVIIYCKFHLYSAFVFLEEDILGKKLHNESGGQVACLDSFRFQILIHANLVHATYIDSYSPYIIGGA